MLDQSAQQRKRGHRVTNDVRHRQHEIMLFLERVEHDVDDANQRTAVPIQRRPELVLVDLALPFALVAVHCADRDALRRRRECRVRTIGVGANRYPQQRMFSVKAGRRPLQYTLGHMACKAHAGNNIER